MDKNKYWILKEKNIIICGLRVLEYICVNPHFGYGEFGYFGGHLLGDFGKSIKIK